MHTKRIARGARWLDQEHPGWADRVRIDKLDPGSNTNCVIGQAVGDFSGVMDSKYPSIALFDKSPKFLKWIAAPGIVRGLVWSIRRGFMFGFESTQDWKSAWAREIMARRTTTKTFVPKAWEAAYYAEQIERELVRS